MSYRIISVYVDCDFKSPDHFQSVESVNKNTQIIRAGMKALESYEYRRAQELESQLKSLKEEHTTCLKQSYDAGFEKGSNTAVNQVVAIQCQLRESQMTLELQKKQFDAEKNLLVERGRDVKLQYEKNISTLEAEVKSEVLVKQQLQEKLDEVTIKLEQRYSDGVQHGMQMQSNMAQGLAAESWTLTELRKYFPDAFIESTGNISFSGDGTVTVEGIKILLEVKAQNVNKSSGILKFKRDVSVSEVHAGLYVNLKDNKDDVMTIEKMGNTPLVYMNDVLNHPYLLKVGIEVLVHQVRENQSSERNASEQTMKFETFKNQLALLVDGELFKALKEVKSAAHTTQLRVCKLEEVFTKELMVLVKSPSDEYKRTAKRTKRLSRPGVNNL